MCNVICKDDLSVERKKRLDRIEVLFGTGENLFGNGVLHHCSNSSGARDAPVPKQHREGHYKLGSWVSVQRRKKNVMPPKRQ